jgi:hypothetical protein
VPADLHPTFSKLLQQSLSQVGVRPAIHLLQLACLLDQTGPSAPVDLLYSRVGWLFFKLSHEFFIDADLVL